MADQAAVQTADKTDKAGAAKAAVQSFVLALRTRMQSVVLVLRGLRALLLLPQNRRWAMPLLSLMTINLLVLFFWRTGIGAFGQAPVKVTTPPVQAEWLAVHAPWQDKGDAHDHATDEGTLRTLRCRRWGPFNAIDLRRVEQLLSDWGGERKLISETEPIAYQVYWPGSAKDTAKFTSELRIKGFADAMVSSSEDITRGQVTYGTFRSRAQAKAKIEYLESKGFPGAVIFTRMGPAKTVYELRGDEDQIDQLREIRAKIDFGELTGCTDRSGADQH